MTIQEKQKVFESELKLIQNQSVRNEVARLVGLCQDYFFKIPASSTGKITKKSAEEHLKENYHHYSHNAKTYALSAWRNPIYEKLIEIIKTTNWNDLNDNNLNK